jgi:hypothetical protein
MSAPAVLCVGEPTLLLPGLPTALGAAVAADWWDASPPDNLVLVAALAVSPGSSVGMPTVGRLATLDMGADVSTLRDMAKHHAAILAAGMFAAACGGSSGDTTADAVAATTSPPSSVAAPAAPETTAASLPDAAPNGFDTASILTGSAVTVAGAGYDLGSLQGKDLVVWFWAPW